MHRFLLPLLLLLPLQPAMAQQEDPVVTLVLASETIDEGGETTLTARIAPAADRLYRVGLWWDGTGTCRLHVSTGYMPIRAGDTESAPVTVSAAGNATDEPNRECEVGGIAHFEQDTEGTVLAPVTLTVRDNDPAPKVMLDLSPASILEKGGVSRVTASLSRRSSEDTLVTVSPAAAGDYTLGENPVLRIPAGQTESTGAVEITAVDNDVQASDKEVTVSATAMNTQGIMAPDPVTLTILDDETLPAVDMLLEPEKVKEGGTSTLRARLSRPASRVYRVGILWPGTICKVVGDDLDVQPGEVLSPPVTITALDNDVDAPDKQCRVNGLFWRLPDPEGTELAPVTLTIEDDDVAPTVMLDLSPASILENGGVSRVTARLSHPSSENTVVTVSAAAEAPADAGDYTLGADTVLTIPAGKTESTAAVTIAAVDNDEEAPAGTVTVSATASNSWGIVEPDAVTLTIRDDEAPPEATLLLAPGTIWEGGTSTVTASLSHPSSADTTLTVSTAGGDHTLSENRELTVPAGATESTGLVTITVADKGVTISASVENAQGVAAPDPVTLAVAGDRGGPVLAPTVMLNLLPASIAEDGGVSRVTARLDRPSGADTVVTISAVPAAGGYRLSANTALTIPAGAVESEGLVTIAAVDNDERTPDRTVAVSAAAANIQGVTAPQEVMLTIRDDDERIDERQRRLQYALASFGRTVAQDLVAAVEERRRSAAAGTMAMVAGARSAADSFRPEEAFSRALQRPAGRDGAVEGGAALRALLSRSRFQLALGREGEGAAGGSGPGPLVLWGRGSRSWSEGEPEPGAAVQGEAVSGQLGVEYRIREDWLAGVMLNGSGGELEFDKADETKVETDLASLHPYAQWAPQPGVTAWGMLGYGVGEAVLSDSLPGPGGGIGTAIEMTMAAAGGSRAVASLWGMDWSLGANGFLVQLDADERKGELPAVEAEAWQARVLLEGGSRQDSDGGSGLAGNIALAARMDGGDAQTGLGMELGGGIAYRDAALGVEFRAGGRVLLAHEEGLEDAGASLGLSVDPGARGRGVYVSLAPSWGSASSGVPALWAGRQADIGGAGPDAALRLGAEFGYAAPLSAGGGALVSYGAFSSGGGAARYRIGRRLELAGMVLLGVEAERRESAAPEHSIQAAGRPPFLNPPPRRKRRRLPGRPAAVHQQARPGNQRGGRRGEEGHGRGHLGDFAQPPERDAAQHEFAELPVPEERPGERRFDEGGAHRVRPDAVGRELDGHRLGHALERMLGGAIDRAFRPADMAHLRGHVDDGAAPAGLDHAPRRRLRHDERRLHIERQHGVEGRFLDLQEMLRAVPAGIVDQHIDTREFREDPPHGAAVGDIQHPGFGAAALRADLRRQALQLGPGARRRHDMRAQLRQRQRAAAPEAPPGAGDDRGAAVQPQRVGDAHVSPRPGSRRRASSRPSRGAP